MISHRRCSPRAATAHAIRTPFLIACGLLASVAAGDEKASEDRPSDEAIRAAVAKSLPLLERGARGSMEQRKQCFTCHNQGLPLMALRVARSRGFEIDQSHFDQQIAFIAEFLERNRQKYLDGQGTGGQADTAGYALWTLDQGGWKPDQTTAAVAEYLLNHQKEDEHWSCSSRRPPSEASAFTTTYLALRGLRAFGTAEQKERIEQRRDKAKAWLIPTAAEENEDRVFRLRALRIADASEEQLAAAVAELRQAQRPDGGWSQLVDMASDAYATGTALVALHEAGGVATTDSMYVRGLCFLISKQEQDGSWHVKSRSEPFQTYFESGYPHGADQFISIAAASWSTTALTLALSEGN